MTSLLEGRVAFVTGAARGQGRSHAVRLAREGASIIAVDIAGPAAFANTYPAPTEADLDETVRLVEAEGARIVARVADVRDQESLDATLAAGVAEFGNRLDVVVANAGICNWGRFWEMPDDQWQTLIDINLTGVWRTMQAAVPHMLSAGNGGSIIDVGSITDESLPGQAHYSAAKHGVVGLTKSAALELGEYRSVNSIHPSGVATAMAEDPMTATMLTEHPAYRRLVRQRPAARSRWPTQTDDISDAVVWLASDLSRP